MSSALLGKVYPNLAPMSGGDDAEKYQLRLKSLLPLPVYVNLAVAHMLSSSNPSDELLGTALGLIENPETVEHLCWRDPGIPIKTMEKLLTSPVAGIRAAAATGEWQKDPKGSVRSELQAKWRAALTDVNPNHYALVEVFEKKPSLAFDWIQSGLKSSAHRLTEYDQGFLAAASAP